VRGVADLSFSEMAKEDAPGVVRSVFDALRAWNEGGPGQVAAVASGTGFVVWADVGEFCLVACERVAGQPYRPCAFAREADALDAARRLEAVLKPSGVQEVYLNDRHFSR
jgi:hypothetical protein